MSVSVTCVAVGESVVVLNGNCACQYPGVILVMLAIEALPFNKRRRVTLVDVVALNVTCVPLLTTFGERVT